MSENSQYQKQEKIESSPIENPWKIFAFQAFLFCLTLALGIATAFKLNQFLEVEKVPLPQISFWKFVVTFFLATVFFLSIIHFLKFRKEKGTIFKIIFVLAVAFGGLLFLETWLPQPLPLIIVISLIFWWWKKPSVLNQNISMILGISGIGSTLGLALEPSVVVGLLIIFSIYDYIAVYKTKHMVKMAKEMIEEKAILALVVPSNVSEFRADLGEIKPGGKFLILGSGDVVFPLLLCVSLIPEGVLNSIIVAFFSLIGLFLSFYILTKRKARTPIPALPPIAFFSIVGFLITRLI